MKHVGLDIHREYCQATVMADDGTIVMEKKIATNKKEIIEFFQNIKDDCRVVMESTTVWEYIYESIEDLGIDVKLINPRKTKAIAEAKVMTDKISSKTLANLSRLNMIAESHIPPKDIRELRKFVRERVDLKKEETAIKNRIYSELTRRGIPYKKGILNTKHGRKWTREILNSLRIEWWFDILGQIEKTLEIYNLDLEEKYDIYPDAKILTTIAGIGQYTALTIFVEFSDINRFKDSDDVVKYAGLDSRVHISEDTTYYGRISKEGSSTLRWALGQAARNHLIYCKKKSECFLCKFYKRLVRKKGKNKAKVALSAKLARVIFWMLKLKKEFNYQGVHHVLKCCQ